MFQLMHITGDSHMLTTFSGLEWLVKLMILFCDMSDLKLHSDRR
jgi:hypothetical protein